MLFIIGIILLFIGVVYYTTLSSPIQSDVKPPTPTPTPITQVQPEPTITPTPITQTQPEPTITPTPTQPVIQPTQTQVQPTTQPEPTPTPITQVQPEPTPTPTPITQVQPETTITPTTQVQPEPTITYIPPPVDCVIGEWSNCPVSGGGYRTRTIIPAQNGGSCSSNVVSEECGRYRFTESGGCDCVSVTKNGSYKCVLSDGTQSSNCVGSPPTRPACSGSATELQNSCPVRLAIVYATPYETPTSVTVRVSCQIDGINVKDVTMIITTPDGKSDSRLLTLPVSLVTITDLSYGMDYTLKLSGIHTLSGNRIESNSWLVTTPIPYPKGLTLTRQSDPTKVLFQWQPVQSATKYNIYVGNNPRLIDTLLVTLSANATSYLLDLSAPPGGNPPFGLRSAYHFSISADGMSLGSQLSPPVSITGVDGTTTSYKWECRYYDPAVKCYVDGWEAKSDDYTANNPDPLKCGGVPVIPFGISCWNKSALPPPKILSASKSGGNLTVKWDVGNLRGIGGIMGYNIYYSVNGSSSGVLTVSADSLELSVPSSLIGATSTDRIDVYIVTVTSVPGPQSEVVVAV
jgi:hypothetical protein